MSGVGRAAGCRASANRAATCNAAPAASHGLAQRRDGRERGMPQGRQARTVRSRRPLQPNAVPCSDAG